MGDGGGGWMGVKGRENDGGGQSSPKVGRHWREKNWKKMKTDSY